MDNLTQANQRYFLKNEANGLGFHVIGCGRLNKQGEGVFSSNRRTLDCYAMVFLHHGCGVFESNLTRRQLVGSGDIMLLFPGEWHEYGPRNLDNWHEYWFLFDGMSVRRLQESGYIRPQHPVFHVSDIEYIKALFRQALHRASTSRELVPLLFTVLHEICHGASISSGAIVDDPLLQLVRAIEQDPAQDRDFEHEAKQCGMSYSLLRRRLKAMLGVSPHRFHNRERMRVAREHLAAGHSIKETCRLVGMTDPYHFSRLFKQFNNQSPRAFAESISVWQKQYVSRVNRAGSESHS